MSKKDFDYIDFIETVEFTVDREKRTIMLLPTWADIRPKYVMKSKIFEKFLMEQEDYFSVNEVTELLGLKQNAVLKLIKNKQLQTYELKWADGKESNIKKVIHAVDLIVCLQEIGTRAFERYTTFSRHRKDDVKDIFWRKEDNAFFFRSDKTFYVLENELDAEDFKDLCYKIGTRRVKLYSKNELKRIVGKSDTTMNRLIKCLPTFHFNLTKPEDRATGKEVKDTTRVALPVTLERSSEYFIERLEGYYKEYCEQIIYSLSSNLTTRIQLQLSKDELPFVDYRDVKGEVSDFIALHLYEGCMSPDLIVRLGKDIYFAVSNETVEKQGYSNDYVIHAIQQKKKEDQRELARELQRLFMPQSNTIY